MTDLSLRKNFAFFAFTLFLATATPLLAHSGGHVGNGGDTAQMRRQETSREQVIALLRNNGEKLKKEYLLPLVTYLGPDRITDSVVRTGYEIMLGAPDGGLQDDILFTIYDTIDSPECQAMPDRDSHVSAYTLPMARGRVCFDIEKIVLDGDGIESIVGLAMHEHTHHFGVDDHATGDEYRIANYFKNAITQNEHLQPGAQIFGSGQETLRVDGHPILADIRYNAVQEIGRAFCSSRGYARMQSHSRRTQTFEAATGLLAWTYSASRPAALVARTPGSSTVVFTSITCSR